MRIRSCSVLLGTMLNFSFAGLFDAFTGKGKLMQPLKSWVRMALSMVRKESEFLVHASQLW